jgi:hypothetical protein
MRMIAKFLLASLALFVAVDPVFALDAITDQTVYGPLRIGPTVTNVNRSVDIPAVLLANVLSLKSTRFERGPDNSILVFYLRNTSKLPDFVYVSGDGFEAEGNCIHVDRPSTTNGLCVMKVLNRKTNTSDNYRIDILRAERKETYRQIIETN